MLICTVEVFEGLRAAGMACHLLYDHQMLEHDCADRCKTIAHAYAYACSMMGFAELGAFGRIYFRAYFRESTSSVLSAYFRHTSGLLPAYFRRTFGVLPECTSGRTSAVLPPYFRECTSAYFRHTSGVQMIVEWLPDAPKMVILMVLIMLAMIVVVVVVMVMVMVIVTALLCTTLLCTAPCAQAPVHSPLCTAPCAQPPVHTTKIPVQNF